MMQWQGDDVLGTISEFSWDSVASVVCEQQDGESDRAWAMWFLWKIEFLEVAYFGKFGLFMHNLFLTFNVMFVTSKRYLMELG
jgi:hypothetical protein